MSFSSAWVTGQAHSHLCAAVTTIPLQNFRILAAEALCLLHTICPLPSIGQLPQPFLSLYICLFKELHIRGPRRILSMHFMASLFSIVFSRDSHVIEVSKGSSS